MRIIAKNAMKTVLKLVGSVIGYRLVIGIVKRFITRLTTPPITKKMAAMSTNACFNGEILFIARTYSFHFTRNN